MSGRLVAWMFATFGAVTAHAQTSIALPGDRVFPENIAASRDGALYVGSVGQGGVIRIEPHSKEAKVWIKPGAFGTHSTFGVLADDKTNTLWVCSNDLTARGVTINGSDGISALKGFDLKTGEGKISAALPTKPATCNDITIGPDGSTFVGRTAWVSEGQLSYLFDPALKDQKPSLPFQISAVALPAAH
jgi:sugar lactone lactonase YvrE